MEHQEEIDQQPLQGEIVLDSRSARRGVALPSPKTPTACMARGISRKYKRLQRRSPLSATARRLLLQKFATPRPSVLSLTLPSPVEDDVLSSSQFVSIVKERYPSLKMEEFMDDKEKWIVIYR